MHPKLVALIVAASLTIGWLLASIVSPPVAELQVLPSRTERAPVRAPRVEAPYTEQLNLRLQSAPVAPVPRRNPFVFGGVLRRSEPRASAGAARETAAPPADAPAPAAEPILRLSGIGLNETPAGPVRTAVISDGATVHLVKVGETFAGNTVVELTDAAVVIVDAAGQQRTLRLK